MGYLDNTTLTVDAILTKKGRQLLSEGALEITKFALADDEVDYRLWDAAHSLGTNYYGQAIENMPLLEAFAKENQMMRYKLITLPKNTTKLPLVQAGMTSISLARPGLSTTITPTTANIANGKLTVTEEDDYEGQEYVEDDVEGLFFSDDFLTFLLPNNFYHCI